MCDTPSNCYYHKDILQLIDMVETNQHQLNTILKKIQEIEIEQAKNHQEITDLTKKINQMEKKQQ